ncbi:hypothetical protein WDW86_16995 [Bdellovibrionota bacterium FG-2]
MKFLLASCLMFVSVMASAESFSNLGEKVFKSCKYTAPSGATANQVDETCTYSQYKVGEVSCALK